MAYEEITDLSTPTVVKIGGPKETDPESLEGYYLGTKPYKNENGTGVIHVFQTKKGNMGAWGSKDLDTKLLQVPVGTCTLVTYVEKKKLAGGKTIHVFSVKKDSSNTIVVGLVYDCGPAGSESASEPEKFTKFQPEAAAGRTRVQELLNNRAK